MQLYIYIEIIYQNKLKKQQQKNRKELATYYSRSDTGNSSKTYSIVTNVYCHNCQYYSFNVAVRFFLWIKPSAVVKIALHQMSSHNKGTSLNRYFIITNILTGTFTVRPEPVNILCSVFTHTHTHTHTHTIYIYIYMCVCVCMCYLAIMWHSQLRFYIP